MLRDEPTSERRQLVGQIIQCAIACLGAGLGFWWAWPYPENEKVPLFAALIAGFGLWYLSLKLYVLIRFGWKAMRSMSLNP